MISDEELHELIDHLATEPQAGVRILEREGFANCGLQFTAGAREEESESYISMEIWRSRFMP